MEKLDALTDACTTLAADTNLSALERARQLTQYLQHARQLSLEGQEHFYRYTDGLGWHDFRHQPGAGKGCGLGHLKLVLDLRYSVLQPPPAARKPAAAEPAVEAPCEQSAPPPPRPAARVVQPPQHPAPEGTRPPALCQQPAATGSAPPAADNRVSGRSRAAAYELIGKWVMLEGQRADGEWCCLIAQHHGIGWGSLCLFPLHHLPAPPMLESDIPLGGWTAHTAYSRGGLYLQGPDGDIVDAQATRYRITELPEHLAAYCQQHIRRIDDACPANEQRLTDFDPAGEAFASAPEREADQSAE